MGRGHLRVSGYIFSQTAALHNLFLERSQKQQGYSRASFHTFKFKRSRVWGLGSSGTLHHSGILQLYPLLYKAKTTGTFGGSHGDHLGIMR